MITSTIEDQRFGADFLQNIIGWIAEQFTIDEVYSRLEIEYFLEQNAEEYGYTREEAR